MIVHSKVAEVYTTTRLNQKQTRNLTNKRVVLFPILQYIYILVDIIECAWQNVSFI